MKIFRVLTTEATADYTPALFVETSTAILLKIGGHFIPHPNITTPEELKKHLDNLKKEGFEIRATTITL